MTYVEAFLTLVAAHLLTGLGTLAGCSILGVTLTRLFSASVKYRVFPKAGTTSPDGSADPPRVNVVLKNLEASAIPGSDENRLLELVVQPKRADVTIKALRSAAGPWISTVTRSRNNGALTIAFRKLPAEAAIAFSFELSEDESDLKLEWSGRSQGVKPLKPLAQRFFGPAYFWKRGLFGLAWYIALFSMLVTQRATRVTVTYVEAAIFLGGVALVALAWFFALPMSGKMTACGYPMRPTEIAGS